MMTPAVSNRARALACAALAALLGPAASAQVVLDNFSTDLHATSYTFKTGDTGSFLVSGGELQLSSSSAYNAWIWSGGQTLASVGDYFSANLTIGTSGNSDHNGGLAAWGSSTANTAPATDRYFEPRVAYTGTGYTFTAEFNNGQGYTVTTLDGTPAGAMTLRVTLSGQTASTRTLTATLSGSGFSTISQDYTFNFSGPLYVGPSSYLGNGANVGFDNLTYYSMSAIPEPSTYAALCSAAALGFATWRRRRARSAPPPSIAALGR